MSVIKNREKREMNSVNWHTGKGFYLSSKQDFIDDIDDLIREMNLSINKTLKWRYIHKQMIDLKRSLEEL